MITSAGNHRVKEVIAWRERARERKAAGVFLTEGVKMFEEAPLSWIRDVYVSCDLLKKIPRNGAVWKKLEQIGYEEVSGEVFDRMSDTQTPQGLLAVLRQPRYTLENILDAEDPLLVVLEDLRDPGNLGTILRTAEGAGVNGIILSVGCADIFNPKVIRSTMGSIYRVPFVYVEDVREALETLEEAGVHTYAAYLRGDKYYDGFSYAGATAFVIGNESAGLRDATACACCDCVKIPMEGSVESLNAAVSAALLMYEAHRQRSGK